MLTAAKRLARRRIDEKLEPLQSIRSLIRPQKGWIRTIRDAVGMTGTQFAKRLGVAWQSMDDLERSEAAGTIQLDKLRRAAEALDCTLVYAIIPNRPLENMVEARARAIAIAAIRRVDQTMTLEDQKVDRESEEHLIEDYIRDHVRDRDLWSEPVTDPHEQLTKILEAGRNAGNREPRVYLDQNVLGYIRDGLFPAQCLSTAQVIYSAEHLAELSRMAAPETLLDVLDRLEAVQIEILQDERGRLTDQAFTHPFRPTKDVLRAYQQTSQHLADATAPFHQFLAQAFGGDGLDRLQKAIADIPHFLETIIDNDEPTKVDLLERARTVSSRLMNMTAEVFVEFDPEKVRREMGTGKGRAGAVSEKSPIPELWRLIAPQLPGTTMDQFFGFDPIDRMGYEKWPTYLGIAGCHMALNFLGFRPDKGLGKLENIAASMSDAAHIGYAAYCGLLISADRRLCAKASAIYRYRGIGTAVGRLMLPGAKDA